MHMQVKKQREAAKRDQQAMPTEYISYRHFSIQSSGGGGEAGQLAAKQQLQQQASSLDSQTQQQQLPTQKQPSFITSSCPGAGTPNL